LGWDGDGDGTGEGFGDFFITSSRWAIFYPKNH
jgi:hypothetical protein